ncbi:MAG: SUMF1/EgtB/PvdO family nonheme iron enzyme [Myxococcota bacterium]|nr:SUMF1/EgtB/PvdO family nonheme iron enzyme [Myxococcota bacterium]
MIILLLACSTNEPTQIQPTVEDSPPTQQTPAASPNQQVRPPQHGQNASQNRPPKGTPQMRNQLPAAANPQEAWSNTLATPVSKIPTQSTCPDSDDDGFPDARQCTTVDSAQLDCDDSNPEVTPANERYIPASPFLMGSQSKHAGHDEGPVHVVQLSGYCLDVNEVTAGEFDSWLNANQRLPSGPDIRNYTNATQFDSSRAAYPAEGVTWEEANEYCNAINKALPTEAQWEKASRGGCELGSDPNACDQKDLRPYPWGFEAPTCALANHQLSTSQMPHLCHSDTLPVDQAHEGIGPYGHAHLSGNVWEYVQDYWHPKTYQSSSRVNPSGPENGDIHTLRGGGWNTFSTNMRSANRFHDLVMGSAAGFRCARNWTNTQADSIPPLELTTLQGTISSTKPLLGRAIYVTAFAAEDADATGMVPPGRSPIAEQRYEPNGENSQGFELRLPLGGNYILSAALDAGTGAQKDEYISASGSGGFGQARENPIDTSAPPTAITIVLTPPPQGGPLPANGPKRPKGRPPQNAQ